MLPAVPPVAEQTHMSMTASVEQLSLPTVALREGRRWRGAAAEDRVHVPPRRGSLHREGLVWS